jgi:UPF0716 protein FxsA
MRFSLFPLVVIFMPIMEIAGFIIVGKALGLWLTLALIVLTSFAGLLILRSGGLGMLRKVSVANKDGVPPAEEMIHGAVLVVAGILLFLPGFITDLIGILLLIPFVRRMVWATFGHRVAFAGSFAQRGPFSQSKDSGASSKVVDLDDEDFHREGSERSPWRPDDKHNNLPKS